jgi:V-type H+-transporting ATPase subunit a
MFLTPGVIKHGEQLFSGQGNVQFGLVIIAGICVPWMLCTKPYIIWKEMKRTKEQGYGQIGNEEEEGNGIVQEIHEDGEDGEDEVPTSSLSTF